MNDPRTEAGRRLLAQMQGVTTGPLTHIEAIAAIEAEAVTAALERLGAVVEGLMPVMVRKDHLVPDPKWDDMVTRAAVLHAIDEEKRNA